MTRTGIKLDLDVGDLVSNAGRARGAISALGEAMKKAEKEGRFDDYGKLAYEQEKLQGKIAGFDKDIRTLANNPNFQAQGPNGLPILKVDAEYAKLIKEQTDAMQKLTAEYVAAIRNGDVDKARAISPQIEKQQDEFHKTIIRQDKPQDNFPDGQTTGYTPKTPQGIAGNILASAEAAQAAVRNIDARIEQAKKTGDPKLGELYYSRDKVKTSSASLITDIVAILRNPRLQQVTNSQMAGKPLTKSEEKYVSRLDTLNDSLKKNTEALLNAISTGDTEEILKQAHDLGKQADFAHKFIDEQTGRGMQDAVRAIGIGQLTSSINEGFSRWVGSLDRSGIINQYGSGDILGGRIAEKRRQANLWGGIAQVGLGIAGTALGFIIGGPSGAMLGGTLGTAAGAAVNTGLQIGPNRDATSAAYSGLWQQRSADAMELAALQGTPNLVRDAFKTAADAAVKFGYSAEEGMDAMKQAARQGLDGAAVREMTEQTFQYERATGADRATLSSIANMSARYGTGDALKSGWAGLQASGMKTGQFNEYARGMARILEDAISKGFYKSTDQIARNLTLLARMTDNDPLWQGENGVRRLMEMDAGLASATGLQSATDILAYRAAKSNNDRDYVDTMVSMEKGLTPDIFRKFMDLASSAEGGSRVGIIERMRQAFGLNYTNARTLYEDRDRLRSLTNTELQKILDEQKGLPDSSSAELKAAIETESIKNWWTQTGQKYWDVELPKLRDALREAIQQYNRETGGNVPLPPPLSAPAEANPYDVRADEARNAYEAAVHGGTNREFEQATIDLAIANAYRTDPEFQRRVDELNNEVFEVGDRVFRRGGPFSGNRPAFFTGDGNPFASNDDEEAYGRFMAYGQMPVGTSARDAFHEAAAIMGTFTEGQMRKVNDDDSINRAIPDVMTDRTGQQLLEAIRQLNITVNIPY